MSFEEEDEADPDLEVRFASEFSWRRIKREGYASPCLLLVGLGF